MPDPIRVRVPRWQSINPISREAPSRWRSLLWLLLPSAIVAACTAGAMFWRLPTKVVIQAIVTQVQFHTVGRDQQVILERADARSLVLSRFKEVRLTPEAVWIFNLAKYDIQRNSYAEGGWMPLPALSGKDLVLIPAGRTSDTAVTIQPDNGGANSVALGPILTRRGTVTLSVPEPRLLSLELRGSEQAGSVQLPVADKLMLLANSCAKEGSLWPYPGASVALRIQLGHNNPLLEYTAPPSGILFQTRFAEGNAPSLLDEWGLAIDGVAFTREGSLTGRPQSTLAGPGSITFDGQRGVEPVSLEAGYLLNPSDLREFRVLGVALTKDDRLKVRLGGLAGDLFSGPPGDVLDRRLTLFDMAWHNPKLAALFTILVWLIPTLIAGRKFLREQQNGPKPS